MSPRTGRPPAAEPRIHLIRYRVTDAELALLTEAAGAGAENTYAREQAITAARREVRKRERT